MNERSRSSRFMEIAQHELPALLDRKRLLHLRQGEQLTDLFNHRHQLFLIETAVISLGADLADGRGAEVALLACGDVLRLSTANAWGVMPYRGLVQRAGTVWQFNIAGLQDELLSKERLAHYIRGVLQRIFVHITQSALCFRHHHIDQQLARALLQYQDLTRLDNVSLTQQQLSEVLGVRREGVTQAIGKLQSLGIVESRRGSVCIINRPKLQSQACECYRRVAHTLESLPSTVSPDEVVSALAQRRFSATKIPAVSANTPEITPAFISALT